jgi:CO/xanthine dehydrogenase Mo-binding subunit
MRSPADVQSFFGWEQHVDLIAHGLGIDPLELRILNVIREGQTAVTDEIVPHPVGFAVLEALRRESRYDEPVPAGRGRGISFVCRHTGQGNADVRLALAANGMLTITTGLPDQGGGGHTMVQRVAAATLCVDPARISVRRLSTGAAPADPGAGSSRVTHVQGAAAKLAAEKMRATIEGRSGLTLRHDHGVDERGREYSIEDIASEICADGPIEVVGHYESDHHTHDDPADFSFSAFAIEVDVDTETGAVAIRDALLVTDVAKIINPVGHQGQLDGGFIYGIGGALMEEMPLDESGRLGTPSLAEYKVPTIMDIPPFRTVHVPGTPGRGPFGAKMAGELSNSGVAPAIVNAIDNAVGVRLFEMPVTAERVHTALLEKNDAAAPSERFA